MLKVSSPAIPHASSQQRSISVPPLSLQLAASCLLVIRVLTCLHHWLLVNNLLARCATSMLTSLLLLPMLDFSTAAASNAGFSAAAPNAGFSAATSRAAFSVMSSGWSSDTAPTVRCARGSFWICKVGIGTEYRSYAVSTPYWKLAYFPEQGEGRLFDRVNDPTEQDDLYNDTSVRSTRDGLLSGLLKWRAQQDSIGWESEHSTPGAQTATNAFKHTTGLRGIDAEKRLQEEVLVFGPRKF